MQFKEGLGWKACYDEERNLYTAQRKWRGFYQLCEIDKETYDKLGPDATGKDDPDLLIGNGRHLVEADDDYYTAPTVRVYDENYFELAPWSDARKRVEAGEVTCREITDFAVENFASEDKNRRYREEQSRHSDPE
jgi:hypothetical protein